MSLALLILALGLPAQPLTTREELEQAIKGVAKGDPQFLGDVPVPDPDFVVTAPMDLAKLGINSTDTAFHLEMKQGLSKSCLLNAIRFAVQRRRNVRIGKNAQGDRALWSMIKGRYFENDKFEGDYVANNREAGKSLTTAKTWLGHTGIEADASQYVTSMETFITGVRGTGATFGMVFVSGRVGTADHTYVVYDVRKTGPNTELKVYDPLTGRNLIHNKDRPNRSEWIRVDQFQLNYAIPVDQTGDKDISPTEETHYEVMFVPMI